MFVYNNALLLVGNLGQILRVCGTAFLGVLALAYAVQNFLGGRLPFYLRGMLFIGSGCMIHPGLVTDLVGLGIVLPLMIARTPNLWRRIMRLISSSHEPDALAKGGPAR
jgi:TRAP-type uncharacterized transport system fused permease subunit